MNKKNLNIVLAAALIAAFFLPYLSIPGFTELSGFNVVFGKAGMTGIAKGGKFLFISLLIPLGAIIVLFDSLGSSSSSTAGYGYWMPIAGIVILSVLMFLGMSQGASSVGGSLSVGSFVEVLGYGYWITLAASIILLFNKGRI